MSARTGMALLSLPAPLRRLVISQPTASRLFQATATRTSSCPSFAPIRQHSTGPSTSTSQDGPSSSVNEAEVSHFNALASEWWDPEGSSRLLHLMNPLRHRFIQRCTNGMTLGTKDKGYRYLDIGCGGGIFAESAARLPTTRSVTAVDPTPEVISVARRHQRNDPLLLEPGRLTYRNHAIEQLPLPTTPSEGYDIVSVFEVVEHIQEPSSFLRNALKHLKPGGWLIGSTIARTNTSWLTTKFIAEDVMRIVPRGTHDWNQYIQPYEMKNWASKEQDLDLDMGGWQVMGVVYVPGIGWKEVQGSEDWGNYFFGIRKKEFTS